MCETLLASCGKGIYPDPTTNCGECLTANLGTGSFGKLHTPDEIVRRFVRERRIGSPRKTVCYRRSGAYFERHHKQHHQRPKEGSALTIIGIG